MVAVNAEWLVKSMDGISTSISKEWVALILLPVVGSIAGWLARSTTYMYRLIERNRMRLCGEHFR